MKYDTTGPTTRNEWWSLLVLVCVLVVAAGGIWVGMRVWGGEVKPVVKAAGTARAPVAGSVERIRENYALVHGGDTYVNIYARGNEMSVRRAAGPDDPGLSEKWNIALMVQRAVNNPAVAKAYGLEDKVAELKGLNLQVPALSPAQQSTLGALFLQTQDLTGEARDAVDQTLIAEVAGVAVTAEDKAKFEAGIAKLQTILTREQVEFLRTGRRVTPVVRPAPVPAN